MAPTTPCGHIPAVVVTPAVPVVARDLACQAHEVAEPALPEDAAGAECWCGAPAPHATWIRQACGHVAHRWCHAEWRRR